MNSIYDFTVKSIRGEDVDLSEFRGKVLLIVNTATACGFTPQYEGLEAIYRKYKDRGFEILDFPCNQFADQAPGTEEEIADFCRINYEVSFRQFAKIDVNGENEAPLYTFLKEQQPGKFGNNIKWNFTKFLVDKNGNVVERFSSVTSPDKIGRAVEKLL